MEIVTVPNSELSILPAHHDHYRRKIERRSSYSVGVYWNSPTSRAGAQEMLMASKTEATEAPPQKEVAQTTDTPPLLDLWMRQSRSSSTRPRSAATSPMIRSIRWRMR